MPQLGTILTDHSPQPEPGRQSGPDRLERLQRRRKGEPVLLQTPQKADPAAPALTPKKPPQSDRGLIAGQADSTVADQAAGGSAVAKPAPVACEQSVKRPPLDAASVDLD